LDLAARIISSEVSTPITWKRLSCPAINVTSRPGPAAYIRQPARRLLLPQSPEDQSAQQGELRPAADAVIGLCHLTIFNPFQARPSGEFHPPGANGDHHHEQAENKKTYPNVHIIS
jgi:hypothetical protein